MTTKIKICQFVFFIESQNFDTAVTKYFTVQGCRGRGKISGK